MIRVLRLCSSARVVSVAFWDCFHRQTAVAPNAIELHPILAPGAGKRLRTFLGCFPDAKGVLFGRN